MTDTEFEQELERRFESLYQEHQAAWREYRAAEFMVRLKASH